MIDTAAMSPKQRHAIAHATGRVNIFEGSIRSGKTFSWQWLMLEKIMLAGNDGAIVITGKNRDSIYRNVIEPLLSKPIFGVFAPFINYRQGAPTAMIFGRVVHVIGANDVRSGEKLQGLTVQLGFCDEASIVDMGFFKQLLGRMSVPGAQLFATTNPGAPSHWLKKDYLDRLDQLPGWRRFHFTLDDNPSLDEDYKTSIKTEYTGLWYKRFILGLWVAAEGAVFDMWDEDRYVIPWAKIPPIVDVLGVGVDYGTTNPSTALMLGRSQETDKRPGQLVLLDEWRYQPSNEETRWTDQKLSASMRQWLHTNHLPYDHSHGFGYVIVDPAAASFRVQLKEDGLTTYPAENDVLYGIRTMSSLFNADKLLVTDRCKGFVTEVSGYSWDTKATEKGLDAPIKVADHGIDAARYACATTERNWRRHIRLATQAA